MVGSWRNCALLTYLELEIYLLWRPPTTLTYNTSYILLIYRSTFALRKNLLTHQTNVVFFRNVLATVISRMRSTWRNVPRNVTFKNCLSWSHRTSWRNSGWFKIGTVFSLVCLWISVDFRIQSAAHKIFASKLFYKCFRGSYIFLIYNQTFFSRLF